MRNDPFSIDFRTIENYLIRDRILNCEKPEPGIRECDLSYDQGIGGNLEARKPIAGLINTTGVFTPRSSVQDSQILFVPRASEALSALIEQLCDLREASAIISQNNIAVRLGTALTVHGQVSSAASLFASRSILRRANIDFAVVHNGAILQKAYLRVKNFLLANGIAFISATAGMFVFAQLCPNVEAQTENEFQRRLKVVGRSVQGQATTMQSQAGFAFAML
ncbi:hypothetical protein BHYA_0047g00380 [Botrytis hyacinthi]|uniref:Uncharacterized protein n=1 Tax=Botrytis hyacinthi TaxID=278943 RepID=A0A4Z1GSG3_9HELO|nr:hypothetical protein BHYA_0047g00380 [Botrytis hyacinthi]